jgi:hypothetical protein
MEEHRIRLRGGWRNGDGSPGWLTLPFPPGSHVPPTLVRDWRIPRVEPGHSILVRLEGVSGLLSAQVPTEALHLDCEPLVPGPIELALPASPPRPVRLLLTVAPGQLAGEDGWGHVAVVIRRDSIDADSGRGMDCRVTD